MQRWLDGLGHRDYRLAPASEDASFRSYLRLESDGASFIVMDAPPDKEPCDSFIAVAAMLRAAGLSAPEVMEQNLEEGFLLLTDFGNDSYLSRLNASTAPELYRDALDAIHAMQANIDTQELPAYDEALLQREMDLFHDWFLNRLFEIELDSSQQSEWQQVKTRLVANALEQPQFFVHRDFHSRNLMRLQTHNPGILDFQDAVRGPVTYDLVSLLRDCYIDWPLAQVEQMVLEFHRRAHEEGRVEVGAEQFMRWFDRMGLQRHLKAIGIFSRLCIRDGKQGYLKDIPRTYSYVVEVCRRDEAMAPLFDLISALDLGDRVGELGSL